MVVNHGGNLPKAYFTAYLNLIIFAKACTLERAKQEMLDRFFKGYPDFYGPVSYQSFASAIEELNDQ